MKSALVVDNSLTIWFLEDDPALVAYRDFQERFGNDEVVVLVVNDCQSLLSPGYFKQFIRVTQSLEAIPEVETVVGPGNITVPDREQLGIFSAPLLADESDSLEVRQRLDRLPELRGQLFSPDYQTARFLIVLKRLPDFDRRRGEILGQIKKAVYAPFPAKTAFLGGVGIIYDGLNTLSRQDFGFFLGVGYLIMALLLLWIYRSFLLLLYTVGIVALSTYLTLGVYGALGYRINLMTVLLPVIIALLGIMDAIHVLNEQRQLQAKDPTLTSHAGALAALRKVANPCLFTTLTTAAGFLALETSPMAILQNFGTFAALGIFLCLCFTYLLGVWLLPLARPTGRATQITGDQLGRFLNLVLSRKRIFRSVSLVLMLFFAAGIPLLRTDTYTLGYFPKEHPVVQAHQSIEKAWGFYMPLELLVQPREGYTLHSPQVVRAAMAFADSAQSLPGIGQVFGFYSLYQTGLRAKYGNKSERLLGSKSALGQANKRLQRDYPQLAGKFIQEATQTGRITVSGAMLSAAELRNKMDKLMAFSAITLGKVASVRAAGYQPLYANIVNYVTQSQINSLLMSFGVVFVLVWLFIGQAKLAALTVIPNLFPVLVMLGAMGWLGINLDTATASIAAIVLSFCVDDSIHFIHSYRINRLRGRTPAQSRLATVRHVGPAVVLTSIVLFFGYAFMMLGSLKTVQLWGLLTAIAIVGALYGELVLFPLVLERFDREKG